MTPTPSFLRGRPATRERGAEILGLGLTCALGLRAAAAAAAVRAGLARFRESSTFDRRGQPFILARAPRDRLPDLPEGSGLTIFESTLVRLAASAATEALRALPSPSANDRQIPLIIALPEPPPGLAALVRPAQCLHHLLRLLDLDPGPAQTLTRGRAGGLLALADALALIEQGHPLALAIAADSHDDPTLLAALDRDDRIRADGVYDGFTPGEAGAAILLAAPGTAARLGRAPVARIDAVATAAEPGHRYSPEPHRGDGLAAALCTLFSVTPPHQPIKTVYASLNGEALFAKDWGVAHIRNRDHLDDHARLEHPADCLGDTGAASGLLLTVLAALDQQRTQSSPTLVWAASDRDLRAAALLR